MPFDAAQVWELEVMTPPGAVGLLCSQLFLYPKLTKKFGLMARSQSWLIDEVQPLNVRDKKLHGLFMLVPCFFSAVFSTKPVSKSGECSFVRWIYMDLLNCRLELCHFEYVAPLCKENIAPFFWHLTTRLAFVAG